jgi:hypothetical protein
MKKTLFLCLIGSTLFGDPLITYIGAKAKGMGGAFTAIANNNSAMYFNPAGLTNFNDRRTTSVTLEAGTGSKIDVRQNSSSLTKSSASYFFGASHSTTKGGFGIAYYTLYDFCFEDQSGRYDSLKEEIDVISLSAAYRIIHNLTPYDKGLSIGITLGYASSQSSEDPQVIDVNGNLWSIGAKYRVLDLPTVKMELGANYRGKTTMETDSDSLSTKYKGIGIPQELAYGVAFSYARGYTLSTLSLEQKNTAYEEATEDTDVNLLIPDTITRNIGFELATSKYQLRLGAYKSVFANNSEEYVTGKTVGLAFSIGNQAKSDYLVNLEVSYDARDYTGINEKVNFYTFSLNFSKTQKINSPILKTSAIF